MFHTGCWFCNAVMGLVLILGCVATVLLVCAIIAFFILFVQIEMDAFREKQTESTPTRPKP